MTLKIFKVNMFFLSFQISPADILKSDSQYFTKFRYAANLVHRSAQQMYRPLGEETALKLSDKSKLIELDINTYVVQAVSHTVSKNSSVFKIYLVQYLFKIHLVHYL